MRFQRPRHRQFASRRPRGSGNRVKTADCAACDWPNFRRHSLQTKALENEHGADKRKPPDYMCLAGHLVAAVQIDFQRKLLHHGGPLLPGEGARDLTSMLATLLTRVAGRKITGFSGLLAVLYTRVPQRTGAGAHLWQDHVNEPERHRLLD